MKLQIIPFKSLPSYTWDMYYGNEAIVSESDKSDYTVWKSKYGEGKTKNNKLIDGYFYVNSKIGIYIIENNLKIVVTRPSRSTDVWLFDSSVDDSYYKNKKFKHQLERDKVEKILNTRILGCKYWDLIQEKAKEIYYGGESIK